MKYFNPLWDGNIFYACISLKSLALNFSRLSEVESIRVAVLVLDLDLDLVLNLRWFYDLMFECKDLTKGTSHNKTNFIN